MSRPVSQAPLASAHCQALLDLAQHVIFTIDHNSTITSFNSTAEHTTGVNRAQALGRRCRDVFHDSICRHIADCPMAELLRTGRDLSRRRVPAADRSGQNGTIEVTLQALFDDRRQIVGAVETHHGPPTPGSPAGHSSPVGVGRAAESATHADLPILRATERIAIEEVLRRYDWNRGTACRELGFSRTTLWRKMRKLGITSPRKSAGTSRRSPTS